MGVPLSFLLYANRMRTSATKLPLGAAPAISGLMSNSTMRSKSATNWPNRTRISSMLWMSAAGLPRAPCQQPKRLDLADHSPRRGHVHRRQAERHVAEQLDVNPAQAEHQRRPKRRVPLRAEDQFVARRGSCGGPTCRGFPPPARPRPAAAASAETRCEPSARQPRFNAMPCTSDL